MASQHPDSRRIAVAALVVGLHAAVIALLLRPILVPVAAEQPAIILVDIPLPPAPAPEAPKPGLPEPEAASAPPAPRAKPRPVAQPKPPIIPEPVPSPVAPAPSTGTRTVSGAAGQGPATGASGAGLGAGAGALGMGQGGGGGKVRARWKSGGMDRRDLPAELRRTGFSGSVTAHFDVSASGRPSGCVVVRSSGTPALDQITCRLIEQRFRFHPARDTAGNPVADVTGWRQDWRLDPPG
ncbi:MAG: TonB family protein [Sandaracinobacteroides sp.]